MSTALYTRILVGVDGSEQAERALRQAASIAKAFGAELRIVHVVDLAWLAAAPGLAQSIESTSRVWRAQGSELLAAASDVARDAGVRCETRLLETGGAMQRPAAVLVEESVAWRADLLVIGVRGRGGMERLLIGSVADGVARRSTVPVLLVH